MKQAQNARKGRSRSPVRKQGKGSDGNRVEIKVKGNPKQLLEKYKNQAREATQAGDRVLAETYYQFADHYQRVLNEMRGLTRGLFSGNYEHLGKSDTQDYSFDDDMDDVADDEVQSGASGGQNSQKQAGRRRRGNRPDRPERGQGNERAQAADSEGQAFDDDAENDDDQPTEVHPELDLQQQTSGENDPRRGRGRRPQRRNNAEQTGELDLADGDGEQPNRGRRPRRPRPENRQAAESREDAPQVEARADTGEAA